MKKSFVLVTGGAGGIGREVCQLLADHDFHVIAADRNEKSLGTLEQERITPVPMDITKISSVNTALREIKKITGSLTALVNLAGSFDHFSLTEVDDARFMELVEVNLIGHQRVTNAVFPLLKVVQGRVVNLSSETVLAQMPLQIYGFSKKLMDVWNTQLRMEMRLLGMHVSVIRAGGHQTAFIHQSFDKLTVTDCDSPFSNVMEKIREEGQKRLQRKMSDPQDVAVAVLKSLTSKRPKKCYYVNVSVFFRILSLLPARARENILHHYLMKWM